ncbi:MAG: hypothetical protein HY304_02755 [candidate division Zixibacteria bacterium]|nr:hypothetical protein [candidate division Zixibacteria bacterium]
MVKRTVGITTIAAVLVALGPLGAFAQTSTKPAATTTKASSTATTKTTTVAKKESAPKTHSMMASNEIAICGCGKAFVPDASTQYYEVNGKKYACCSDGCHKMAAADPAAAAKMADDNMAKAMSALAPPAPKTN